MNRRQLAKMIAVLPLIALLPKISGTGKIVLTSEDIVTDWVEDGELFDKLCDDPNVLNLIIPGEYLASFKHTSEPITIITDKIEVTLTPEQAWNIAIDQIAIWTDGINKMVIVSDYWWDDCSFVPNSIVAQVPLLSNHPYSLVSFI
jgi:hypothetical protein